jgi:hypothetical protein
MINSTFVIKREPNWFILILSGLWAASFVVGMFTLLIAIVNNPSKSLNELVWFLLFFSVAWLFALKAFLWNLRGKEKVTLSDEELKIEKIGTILTFPRKFELNNIESITSSDVSTELKQLNFLASNYGRIKLLYHGQAKYFGQTISRKQAEEIIKCVEFKLSKV